MQQAIWEKSTIKTLFSDMVMKETGTSLAVTTEPENLFQLNTETFSVYKSQTVPHVSVSPQLTEK